jgi:hypothetical protein
MAKIAQNIKNLYDVYNGDSRRFLPIIAGNTPFGYYDNDTEFVRDASPLSHLGFFTRNAASVYAEKMRIDGTGNIGIGTSSPNVRLDVYGSTSGLHPSTSNATTTVNLRINRGDAGLNVMDFGMDGSSPFGGWIQVTAKNDYSNTYPLLLNPNGGAVGIGTSNPSGALHVLGNSATNYPIVIQIDFDNLPSPAFSVSTTALFVPVSPAKIGFLG